LKKLNSDESSIDNEEETDTASETKEESIPELLTSFFDPCSANYTTEKINNVGKKLFQNYKNNTSPKQYDNLANRLPCSMMCYQVSLLTRFSIIK